MDIDKYKVGKANDKRIKLTDEDRDEIKRLFFQEHLGVRSIARLFEGKCSRRLIQFVLYPERLKTVNYKGHWKKYYKTENNTLYMMAHRLRKRVLLADTGVLCYDNNN